MSCLMVLALVTFEMSCGKNKHTNAGKTTLSRQRLQSAYLGILQQRSDNVFIHTCRQARCGYIGYCLFVCLFLLFLCVFVRLRISLRRIKQAASNFARRFIGVQCRESPIFVNFAPEKNKIGRQRCAVRDIARRVDVGSACVDIRQSPKTGVLVNY